MSLTWFKIGLTAKEMADLRELQQLMECSRNDAVRSILRGYRRRKRKHDPLRNPAS